MDNYRADFRPGVRVRGRDGRRGAGTITREPGSALDKVTVLFDDNVPLRLHRDDLEIYPDFPLHSRVSRRVAGTNRIGTVIAQEGETHVRVLWDHSGTTSSTTSSSSVWMIEARPYSMQPTARMDPRWHGGHGPTDEPTDQEVADAFQAPYRDAVPQPIRPVEIPQEILEMLTGSSTD